MVALKKKKRKERADDGGAAVGLHLFSFCWVEDRLGPVGGKEDCLEKQTKKQQKKRLGVGLSPCALQGMEWGCHA